MALSSKEISSILYKHYLGTGSTRVNREFFEEAVRSSFIVHPRDMWTYGDRIPDGSEESGGQDALDEIKRLGIGTHDDILYHYISEDKDKTPLVKRWIKLPLTMIDRGTDNAFLITSEGKPVTDIIPFNYYEELYNYELFTADGRKIPFGVGDWTVDIYSGILTFYGELPDGVDHNHPPLLSFYQYIGGNGFRHDTYGYDGAILPLDSIEIPAGICTITNGSEGRTLYQHISDKANEIQDDFVETFGWDGDNKNEGIALSFEKIVPLTYTGNQDAVKGHDKASDSEIGTLLSDKIAKYNAANYEIVFASQKLEKNKNYIIRIENGVAVGADDTTEQDPVSVRGNEWKLYKVWITDVAFVVLKVINDEAETITFTVTNEDKIITCLLLYWSTEDKQYQPFLTKDDVLGNFGFPVVTVNGRLPPSTQLGTAALATFSDVITPDYYGPRTFAVVIAKEDGTDIKSADYIVKNYQDWYLNDILAQVKNRYGEDFRGTLFLRAGTYQMTTDLNLSEWKNVIFQGEGYATTIDLQGHNIIADQMTDTVIELSHLKIERCGSVSIKSSGVTFITDLIMPKVDFTVDVTKTGSVFIKNISGNDITVSGEQDVEATNVDIRDCFFNNVTINKNKTYFKSNTINSLTVDIQDAEDDTLVLRGNIINVLRTKYSDLFVEDNTIFRYSGIAGVAANQIPVGTAQDFTVENYNNDILTTTGRFPIFSKDDFLHMKYAEFASPFNYNEMNNVIELLYDTSMFKIVDGKLVSIIKSDSIMMAEITFDRHENSALDPVSYDHSHSINDVFKHIYMWKADLDPNGKIPLQELPDSVAYGGLLYVGTWSFEKNFGRYPTFKDAMFRQHMSRDEEVNMLQKGWFFIVQEAEDHSDSDTDNDTPVAEQKAVDGEIFTAGDWVIYIGDGRDDEININYSWQKIDRAYSDPTYSPLPHYAKVPGVENLDWYWKKNREAGALDLSGNTIIEAFKKVNDELRKLQPKKSAFIGDVPFVLDEEYPTVSFRKIEKGVIGPVQTKFDTTKSDSYSMHTIARPDGTRAWKELIFFGDEAKLSVNVDGQEYEFVVKKDGEEQRQGPVYVSATYDTMLNADHGEGYWQGFYIEIENRNIDDGEHYARAALDDIKVLYDNDTDTYQFQNDYAGATSTITYQLYRSYFPDRLLLADQSYVTISEVTLNDKEMADACSGIRKINLKNLDVIPGLNFTLKNVYKDHNLPTGKLAELKVLMNDDPNIIFCDTILLDSFIDIEDNPRSPYQNLNVDRVDVPVTYVKKDDILPETTTFDFYLTVYDLYNQPHEIKLYTYTGIRFDPVEEKERVTAGLMSQDSTFKELMTSFGRNFISTDNCFLELCKIGELVDGKPVGVYQQPKGRYGNINFDSNWTGEQIGDDFYGTACFNIGHITEATGFTFEIEGLKSDIEKYSFDKMSGTTNDILLEFCIVDPDQLDLSMAKVTSFLNANSPYDGFSKVDERYYQYPIMYAGSSTATVKRVTFGRNKILSGDVYIRIGLKKDSGLRFTGIKLIEEI